MYIYSIYLGFFSYRLLPYHVVADYEGEEEDDGLDDNQLSRAQQWDYHIAAKMEEFGATFEKQVREFNEMTQKRGIGELRTEERWLTELLQLQEERQATHDLKAALIASRQRAAQEAHEANLQMAAMLHASQARTDEPQTHNYQMMMTQAPIQPSPVGPDMPIQQWLVSPGDMTNACENNAQRNEKGKEPCR